MNFELDERQTDFNTREKNTKLRSEVLENFLLLDGIESG